jgi:hypothetical protein
MSYAVVFSPQAETSFFALPPPVGARVLDHVEQLAEHPARLSRPLHGSTRGGQVFQFEVVDGARAWNITIYFRYGQDEGSLWIEQLDGAAF